MIITRPNRRLVLRTIAAAIAVLLLFSASLFWRKLHDSAIQDAIANSREPASWWPSSWRKEHSELIALADAISHRSEDDTRRVVQTLRDMGRSRFAVPILLSGMRTPDSAFSYRVALILGHDVGPEVREAIPTLIEWLYDDNFTVCDHSFLVLRVAALEVPAVQRAFVDALRRGKVGVRRSAAFNFGVLDWWNIPGAGSALVQAMTDEDSEVRDNASSALDRYPLAPTKTPLGGTPRTE